jgi:hypothetical protein
VGVSEKQRSYAVLTPPLQMPPPDAVVGHIGITHCSGASQGLFYSLVCHSGVDANVALYMSVRYVLTETVPASPRNKVLHVYVVLGLLIGGYTPPTLLRTYAYVEDAARACFRGNSVNSATEPELSPLGKGGCIWSFRLRPSVPVHSDLQAIEFEHA